MIVKELKEMLNGCPDNASVVLQCDHGQNIEAAHWITVSRSESSNDYGDMIFEYENWRDCYDENVVEQYNETGEITAVLIES